MKIVVETSVVVLGEGSPGVFQVGKNGPSLFVLFRIGLECEESPPKNRDRPVIFRFVEALI